MPNGMSSVGWDDVARLTQDEIESAYRTKSPRCSNRSTRCQRTRSVHRRNENSSRPIGLGAMTHKRLFRWVLLVTLAEAAGFTVPAAVGVAVTAASSRPIMTFVAMVLAGSVEGAVLGSAQADCLWRILPARRRWVVAQCRCRCGMVAWNAAKHAWWPELDSWDCPRGRSRRPDLARVFATHSILRPS
jgi:hypothetical protein